MKHFIPSLALAASVLIGGAAFAQTPAEPAKGNAPLKPAHTINDGGARHGASSFTQRQAQRHIERSGFTAVTGLTKGGDGVWRGKATRNGQATDVAMDFKGNVTTPMTAANASPPAMPMATPMARSSGPAATGGAATTATTMTTSAGTGHRANHHRHHRHHMRRHAAHMSAPAPRTGDCANPGVNGAACSGVDLNHNGISDKEDRAIKAGGKP